MKYYTSRSSEHELRGVRGQRLADRLDLQVEAVDGGVRLEQALFAVHSFLLERAETHVQLAR